MELMDHLHIGDHYREFRVGDCLACKPKERERAVVEKKREDYDSGYADGFRDGVEIGKEDGFDAGYDEGRSSGYDEGYSFGYEDGISEA